VTPQAARLRQARPQDYNAIAAVVDGWWGRPVLGILPRLFLDHFWATSLIAEGLGVAGRAGVVGEPAPLLGFLVGFLSPSEPDQAYIHFVGVAPQARGDGLARALYRAFFGIARADGRTVVTAVTSPVNQGSIAFHRAMGFAVAGPVAGHNGPGTEYMTFEHRPALGS
jgi:ribosomal protein S18 acetylase RimI-like enzyme